MFRENINPYPLGAGVTRHTTGHPQDCLFGANASEGRQMSTT
jgi:hypothetical protein